MSHLAGWNPADPIYKGTMITTLIVLYCIPALFFLIILWQGPYTGGGHWGALLFWLIPAILWPLLVVLWFIIPQLKS